MFVLLLSSNTMLLVLYIHFWAELITKNAPDLAFDQGKILCSLLVVVQTLFAEVFPKCGSV